MSESALLCMVAGIVILWISFWIYMLCSVLSDDLEKIKKKLTKLEAEFYRYRIDNPSREE